MILITRRERFNAAHKVFRPEWDEQKNLEVFGKCSNPNWHGHNYELYVTVAGDLDPETGFVMDLKVLSDIIKMRVIDKVDHKNLNMDVDFMKGKMPSTEVLAVAIWEEIEADIAKHGKKLYSVKLYETENNFVEYLGK
ncbi:MAG: 6-pyruvoyl trahydropterin synthase family protein [Bacteroidota bacterium]